MFYVFTNRCTRVDERYWTGEFTSGGSPATTTRLADAAVFDDPAPAYEVAGEASRASAELAHFRVGRRPNPIELRSLIG